MEKFFADRRNYLAPAGSFSAMLRNIGGAGLNLKLVSESQTDNGAVFHIKHGLSPKSLGENITVTLSPLPGEGTGVHVASRCARKFQLFDFGKNENNVRAVFDYLERGLAAAK